VGQPGRFIRLTISSPASPDRAGWLKIVVRRVRLARGDALQVVRYGRIKEHVQPIAPDEVPRRLREWLGMGFRRIHLQCLDLDVHVRITKKGRALVTVGKPSVREMPPPAPHDREKEYPLQAGRADAFLEAAGITRGGRVLSSMRDKFRQLNHFLILLSHSRLLRDAPPRPLRLVDCGCGRALLTLAAVHYLRDIRGLQVRAIGVDANAEVIRSAEALRRKIGESHAAFVVAPIGEFVAAEPPHVVLSLHACDTATDEALARAVEWGASLILAAPCCQHELHHLLRRDELRAVLRHGILRERTADIVTDALRAAALRVMGYRAEVFEFIAPGHTAKNLMIRAERTHGIRRRDAAGEYLALRDFWGVTPAIEKLLGEPFRERIAAATRSGLSPKDTERGAR